MLKTSLAQSACDRNVTQKPSTIAEDVGAILTINGDCCASRERCYVVRNGVIYRESTMGYEALAIMADCNFRGLMKELYPSAVS